MTDRDFNRILSFLREKKALGRTVLLVSDSATYIMYLSYPVFLAALCLLDKKIPLLEILVPGVAFLLVSVFRAVLNSPRPYERFEIKPLKPKSTSGKSFPSRHTFSAFIISFTILSRFPFLGSVLLILSAALGTCRVLSGVHFIRDVVAGFGFAAAASVVYIFM